MKNKFFVFSLIFIILAFIFCNNSFAIVNDVYDIELDFSNTIYSDLGVVPLYDYLHNNNLSDNTISTLQYCVVQKFDSVSYYDIYLSSSPFYTNDRGNLYNSYVYHFQYNNGSLGTLNNQQTGLNNPIASSVITWLVSSSIYTGNSYTTEISDYGRVTKDTQFYNNGILWVSPVKSMSDVVYDIAVGLDLSNLYSVVNNSITLIVVCVLFVFGFVVVWYFLKKIKKGS